MLEGGGIREWDFIGERGLRDMKAFLEIAAYRGRERLIRENCLRKGLIAEKDIFN